MAFSVGNNEHLIRSNLWSTDLKELQQAELMAQQWVKMITDFPDGNTLNIPSIGQAEFSDYAEGQAVKYTGMDTGNFTFSIDQYKQSGTFITEQMKQDSYVMGELVASFVPKQHRAIMSAMETKILGLAPLAQTAADLNAINGGSHRFVATGTNQVITPQDFAKARYALRKAFAPMVGLIAVVDPSVEYTLSTLSNLTNISFNPHWEGIVATGMSTGMRFLMNVYGFDVYTSDYLYGTGGSETINAVTVNSSNAANLFFTTAPDALPFVGCIRQPPKVDSEFNKDLQREEFVTTCRYGYKLWRPENVVVCLSATDQV